jgi:RNA polymerase sigma-70 factor (TIGR02960 family)
VTTELLARARAGDGEAFWQLVEPHRHELQVHCYRVLGSQADAEDLLQETLLAAWQGLSGFAERASLRSWLYRIATNRCLNYLRDGARRPQAGSAEEVGPVATDEPWWLEPYPDALLDDVTPGPEAQYEARESIALSFVAGLQHLPPQQRAALVLRDVLGFSAAEAAEVLGTTPAAVASALQRARAGFRPTREPDLVPLPRSAAEAEVVDRFVDAFEAGDLDRVVAMLAQDAKLTMPPDQLEYRGPLAIAQFLASLGFWGQGLRLVPTRANNQPAFGYYLPDPTAPLWRASGLLVLTLRQGQVSVITRFGDKGLLARFGLPRTLPVVTSAVDKTLPDISE